MTFKRIITFFFLLTSVLAGFSQTLNPEILKRNQIGLITVEASSNKKDVFPFDRRISIDNNGLTARTVDYVNASDTTGLDSIVTMYKYKDSRLVYEVTKSSNPACTIEQLLQDSNSYKEINTCAGVTGIDFVRKVHLYKRKRTLQYLFRNDTLEAKSLTKTKRRGGWVFKKWTYSPCMDARVVSRAFVDHHGNLIRTRARNRMALKCGSRKGMTKYKSFSTYQYNKDNLMTQSQVSSFDNEITTRKYSYFRD